jgi:hypothetical protein
MYGVIPITFERHREIEVQIDKRHLIEQRIVFDRRSASELCRLHSVERHVDRGAAGLAAEAERLALAIGHSDAARDVRAAGFAFDGHVDIHHSPRCNDWSHIVGNIR